MVLGANSPNTMCNIVMMAKATGKEMLRAISGHCPPVNPSKSKTLNMIGVSELSPTHPNPKDASVIPNG